jgi:uncharacterized membrane protein
MKTKTAVALCILIALAVLAYVLPAYGKAPDQIPTHWNAAGKIDAYGSKGTLLIWPFMPLFGLLMLVGLPWLSPKNFQIDTFRETFNYIMVIVACLFGFLALVITYASLNPHFDMTRFIFSGIMLFIGLIGNPLGKVRKNFYMGIRTPWTLASDKVWVATHRLGARLMTAAGLGGALLIWLGLPVLIVFYAFLALVMYPVLYSLLLYKRLEKSGALSD